MPAVEHRAHHADVTVTLHGPRVVYGVGVADRALTGELERLHARRVLLIASPRERRARAGLLEPITDRLAGHIDDVRRHVPADAAHASAELARELDADCLLSIGGGSATGHAKAVALHTSLPIIALPTTYAGSELTPIYGTTSDGVKRTGRSDQALPRTVLLDPALSVDLPTSITGYSAVNAVAHCVSGVFGPGASPLTDLLAAGGLRSLADGLHKISVDPRDMQARGKLVHGSFLAGTVLAHAGSSLHHTICHILGGAFDLPHAETHAAVLPATLAALQHDNPERAAVVADALDARDATDAMRDLLTRVEASVRLRDIGLAASDLPRAGRAITEGGTGMTPARATRLLEVAW